MVQNSSADWDSPSPFVFSSFDVTLLRGHPFMTSKRRGEEVRLRWTHVDGGGGPAPCGRLHRKLKLESTDVILSSSHAKKLAVFFTRISSLDRKKLKIFLRYKLVI